MSCEPTRSASSTPLFYSLDLPKSSQKQTRVTHSTIHARFPSKRNLRPLAREPASSDIICLFQSTRSERCIGPTATRSRVMFPIGSPPDRVGDAQPEGPNPAKRAAFSSQWAHSLRSRACRRREGSRGKIPVTRFWGDERAACRLGRGEQLFVFLVARTAGRLVAGGKFLSLPSDQTGEAVGGTPMARF